MRRYRRLFIKFIILVGVIVCASQVVFRVWMDVENERKKNDEPDKSQQLLYSTSSVASVQVVVADIVPDLPDFPSTTSIASKTKFVLVNDGLGAHNTNKIENKDSENKHVLQNRPDSENKPGLSKHVAKSTTVSLVSDLKSVDKATEIAKESKKGDQSPIGSPTEPAKSPGLAGEELRNVEEAQVQAPVHHNAGHLVSATKSVKVNQKNGSKKNDINLEPPEGNIRKTTIVVKSAGNNAGKIDWHDYDQIEKDKARKGPGEQGEPVASTMEGAEEASNLYKANGFNAYLSQKIAIDRAVPDIRHPLCKKKKYLSALPDASIIFPFHNEHRITLVRSIESILNRSPTQLIKEIILVDDCSSQDDLKQSFTEYLYGRYGDRVSIVRLEKREGLIRARLAGARKAIGKVLIFLDSHIETNVNWLPPLLEPIAEDRKTVVCPFIDVIDMENFAYRAQDEGMRGAFDWLFYYKRLPRLPEDDSKPADPFWNPVMAGGLFAIDAQWFWELGGYDEGLDVWGGEQYELSFKIWMCGGKMVDAPCSRIGHIYRKFNPHGAVGKGNYVMRNYKRVAEVWMDEYKQHLYSRNEAYKYITEGDLTKQKAIRQKLQCKSFHWFMTKIAFDLPKHYPMVEPENVAEGEIRSMSNTELCIDTKFKSNMERFGLDKCTRDNPDLTGEQFMVLTWHNDIRPGKRAYCFDVSKAIDRAPVILYGCHNQLGNQWWKYNVDTHQLFHGGTRRCLDSDPESFELFTSQCDVTVTTQRWKWGKINETLARKKWTQG